MDSFKQHLNKLEQQRKIERESKVVIKKNIIPIVVHGKHASESKKQIKEETGFGETIKKYEDSDYLELKPDYESLRQHEHLDHIYKYTDSSTRLNKGLIAAAKDPNKPLPPDLESHASKLENILSSVAAPKDITVFSGLGFNPTTIADEKNEIHGAAFTSCSISGYVAAGFAREFDENGEPYTYENTARGDLNSHKHILKITIPKGSRHGAFVDHVSSNSGEDEFTLNKNKRLIIDPTPETTTDVYGNGNVVHHHIWKTTIAE